MTSKYPLRENRPRSNPHYPRFPAQSWTGVLATELQVFLRKENNSTLLTGNPCLDCRFEEEKMAYMKTKPCQLPGSLGKWHPPLPATKDGNGNISDLLYSCISNATWNIAVRAPEDSSVQLCSQWLRLKIKHTKEELGEDGDISLPSPCRCLCLSACTYCRYAQVIMTVF